MKKWIIVAIVALIFGIVGYFIGAIRATGMYENQIDKIRETCLDATFKAEMDCADFYPSFEDIVHNLNLGMLIFVQYL